MINRLLIYIFLGLLSQSLFAQVDTMTISGMFYNTNLYIYNPTIDNTFSIKKLIVNRDTVENELSTNGIEIDLNSYEMFEEDPVNIVIIYNSDFPPVIVNPEALMPPVKFRISKPRYSRDGELKWAVRGVPGDFPIIVEQYKWNSWRQVATIDPVDTVANNVYLLKIKPHSGKNIYRVKCTSIKGEEVKSRDCILSSREVEKVSVQNTKFVSEIVLSSKTEYEIYNIEGDLLLSGNERYIDITSLKKGKYKIFFDNQILEFKKKK